MTKLTMGGVLVAAIALTGCGSVPGGGTEVQETESSIQLKLTTKASSGKEYRLGPATFEVVKSYLGGPPEWTLTATGAEPNLHLKVEPGKYDVTLLDGWTLSRVDNGLSTPIAATLLSSPTASVLVDPYAATLVAYDFHVGESGIDFGIRVEDDGIPDGYDGRIVESYPGGFAVMTGGGSGVCCYASVAEAQAAYPALRLLPPP